MLQQARRLKIRAFQSTLPELLPERQPGFPAAYH